jgi:HlyD family secretion protein
MMRMFAVAIMVAAASSLATWGLLREYRAHQDQEANSAADAGRPGQSANPGNPAGSSESNVAALARIEPENGVISISGTPGDRLQILKVKLGCHVEKGDELAVQESHALRQMELELAETEVLEARQRKAAEERYAEATQAEADLAEEQAKLQELAIAAQQQKVAGLQAALLASQQDLRRLEAVRLASGRRPRDQIVSDQQLAHQRLTTEKTGNELAAAKDELKKLQQANDLAHREARAKRDTAEANRARIPSTVQIASLEKQVDLARCRLELTIVRAPSAGEILKIFLSEGETIAQEPILQMADTSRMVAVAEVYEDDVRGIRVDQSACVESPALGARLTGKVSYIGRMVGKNTVVGLDPTASTDRRVVEARILLDTHQDAQPLINLQVTAYIPDKVAPASEEQALAARRARPPKRGR